MKKSQKSYFYVKPIVHTISFEIKLQLTKFFIFVIILLFFLILTSYIPYIFRSLPINLHYFYENALIYFIIILVLASSFFFSGIICSEYQKKTGLVVFPLIKKSQYLIGKYLANLILLIGIITIQYALMILLGYYFYGGPLTSNVFLSYSLALLYGFTLASLITFLSSFNKSSAIVIIIITGLILIGFNTIDPLIVSTFKIEPVYSLSYIYNIIRYILFPNFNSMSRYNPDINIWFFPSIETTLITLSLYGVISLMLAVIVFKRRPL